MARNPFLLDQMDMAKYPLVKEQLKSLQLSLTKLHRAAVKLIELNQIAVIDSLNFGKELHCLISQEETMLFKCFDTRLKPESFYSKFITLSEELNREVNEHINDVREPINTYMDLLTAYKVKI